MRHTIALQSTIRLGLMIFIGIILTISCVSAGFGIGSGSQIKPQTTGGTINNYINQTIINGSSYNETYAEYAYNMSDGNTEDTTYHYNQTSPFLDWLLLFAYDYNQSDTIYFYNMSDGYGDYNYNETDICTAYTDIAKGTANLHTHDWANITTGTMPNNAHTLAFQNLTGTTSATDCTAGNLVSDVTMTNGVITTTCTADQTSAGSTTLAKLDANVTQSSAAYNVTLFSFALAATTNYTLQCNINEFTATAAQGYQINMSLTVAPVWIFATYDAYTATPSFFNCATANRECVYTGTAAIATPGAPLTIDARINMNNNPGTLTLNAKTETAGTVQTFLKGSYCRLFTEP